MKDLTKDERIKIRDSCTDIIKEYKELIKEIDVIYFDNNEVQIYMIFNDNYYTEFTLDRKTFIQI